MFMSGGGEITRSEVIGFSIFVGAVMTAGICWGVVETWYERIHGRKWPAVTAIIDIVSVTFVQDDGVIPSPKSSLADSYYLAQLTYVYHNPELQMGEYNRRFGSKEEAEAWANSYKGESVKVHVDPRDPMRSVLRKEDL